MTPEIYLNPQNPKGHPKRWTVKLTYQGRNLVKDYSSISNFVAEYKSLLGSTPRIGFLRLNPFALTTEFISSDSEWVIASLTYD